MATCENCQIPELGLVAEERESGYEANDSLIGPPIHLIELCETADKTFLAAEVEKGKYRSG